VRPQNDRQGLRDIFFKKTEKNSILNAKTTKKMSERAVKVVDSRFRL